MANCAFFIALLLTAHHVLGADQIEKQRSYTALHQSFRDLQNKEGDTNLCIEPRKEAMWVETDGRIIPSEVRQLPSGMEWRAFHVTQNGLAEIGFPVRIGRPREDVTAVLDSEEIFVIGVGEGETLNMSFSATPAGNGFNVGFGYGIRSMEIRLPQKDIKHTLQKDLLMLLPSTPRELKYTEALELLGISVRVVRER
ncbi:hypothetical protein SH467x_000231 [Pirellulaceae bacterium SH467]